MKHIPPLPLTLEDHPTQGTRSYIVVVGLILLVGYFFTAQTTTASPTNSAPIWVIAVLLCVIVWLQRNGKPIFKKTLKQSPVSIEINTQGIKAGEIMPLIAWDDITEARLLKDGNLKLAGIFFNGSYYQKMTPEQSALAKSHPKFGTHFVFSTRSFGINPDDFVQMINYYKETYGTRS